MTASARFRLDVRRIDDGEFSSGQTLACDVVQDIERIEVLQGSNSAAYGARAILGVINIVTRDLADTLGEAGRP